MKSTSLFILIIINLFGFAQKSFSQDCSNYFKTESCKAEHSEGFRLSSLSRNYYLKVGTSVTYDVVFYGGNEIIIQCCTEEEFYPIRFKIKSSQNGNVIYDNKYNKYIDNLNLQLDHTELLSIEISVDPGNKKQKNMHEERVCIGMAIYLEDISIRR